MKRAEVFLDLVAALENRVRAADEVLVLNEGRSRSTETTRMKPAKSSKTNDAGWNISCPNGDPLCGSGLSSSSNFNVALASARYFVLGGSSADFDPETITQEALTWERIAARGAAVGANDVRPIVGGGVGMTTTYPMGGRCGLGPDTHYELIECDWKTLGQHVVVAVDRRGERHHVPELLRRLFDDPDAANFVRQISGLTDIAVAAVRSRDFARLGSAISQYRGIFNRWTRGAFAAAVERDVKDMLRSIGSKNLGWKPCGAGACKSLVVVVDDPARAVAVIRHLTSKGWTAGPLRVTEGLRPAVSGSGRRIRISAGHRVDLIGAADLGQDPRIGVVGRCLACAVEPRTEWVLTLKGVGAERSRSKGCATNGDSDEAGVGVPWGGNGLDRRSSGTVCHPNRLLETGGCRH